MEEKKNEEMKRKTYIDVFADGTDLVVGLSAEPIRPGLAQDLIHRYT